MCVIFCFLQGRCAQMYVNRSIKLTTEIEPRFQNFVVFAPSSSRINRGDILFEGDEVPEVYEFMMQQLSMEDSLSNHILINRLHKIGQMLDLLNSYEDVVMTKFFDRIWRRYSYVSNIGELFTDLPTFAKVFPEKSTKKEDLLAQRIDDNDEDEKETKTEDANKSESK